MKKNENISQNSENKSPILNLSELINFEELKNFQKLFSNVFQFDIYFLDQNGKNLSTEYSTLYCKLFNKKKESKCILNQIKNIKKAKSLQVCGMCGLSNILFPIKLDKKKIGYILLSHLNINNQINTKKLKNYAKKQNKIKQLEKILKLQKSYTPLEIKEIINFINEIFRLIITKSNYALRCNIKLEHYDQLLKTEQELESHAAILQEHKASLEISAQKQKDIENELKEEVEVSEFLNEVISTGNQTKSLKDFVKIITGIGIKFWNADAGAIYLLENKKNTKYMELQYRKNEIPQKGKEISKVDITKKPFSIIFKNKELVMLSDIKKNSPKTHKLTGFSSAVILPIILGEKVIGTFNFGSLSLLNLKTIKKTSQIHISQEIGNAISKKLTEEKLIDSEQKFRNFFENANDLIHSVNENKNISFHNKKWHNLLGYTTEDMKKIKITDIIKENHIEKYLDIYNRVKEGASFNNVKIIYLTKDKKEIILSGSINGYFKGKKFVATREILRDVTEENKNHKKFTEQMEILQRFKDLTVNKVLETQKIEEENVRLKKKLI